MVKKYLPFLQWVKLVNIKTVKSDLLAGLTGAFIVLPQGVSFAMIAGLPPEYGLYTAMVTPIVAALFGSSLHLISGPTTAISVIIFSSLSPIAEPGTANFIMLAITLTFMAGLFQFIFGLARLGTLINFVSHSVVVGFTASIAVIIATSQLSTALGIIIPRGSSFFDNWIHIFQGIVHINFYEFVISLITLIFSIFLKARYPKLPGMLFAMIIGSVVGIIISGDNTTIRLLGELPGKMPPLSIPYFSIDTFRQLAPSAFAIALLGLIEALSIAKSISLSSNQHIDGNQEFIGQGLSNIVGSFFSCYAGSGSFTRSGINYQSGAVTPLASIFASLFLSLIVLIIAPLTAYLPMASIGAVILVVAFKLIDFHYIKSIFKSSLKESLVLFVTFVVTLFFSLEFAIFIGVFLSLALYLTRTSHPHIAVLTLDSSTEYRLLRDKRDKSLPECPQLKMIRIDGSLFFGAVDHIAKFLEHIREEEKHKHLLIIAVGINFIDISGAHLLINELKIRQKQNTKLYFSHLKREVYKFLDKGKYLDKIGKENIFASEKQAITEIFKRLDENICKHCQARIFQECSQISYEVKKN